MILFINWSLVETTKRSSLKWPFMSFEHRSGFVPPEAIGYQNICNESTFCYFNPHFEWFGLVVVVWKGCRLR